MAKTKRTSFILKIVLVAAVLYLLYVFIGLQIKINEKKKVLNGYKEDIVLAQTENQKLSDVLDAQIDEAYVEKVARDMGYVMSDEKVYQSVTD